MMRKKIGLAFILLFISCLGFGILRIVQNPEKYQKQKDSLTKEEAGQLDEEVWSKVVEVVRANNNLMDAMENYANGLMPELDFYNFCKNIDNNCLNIYGTYPDSKDKNAKSYISSCKSFTVSVQTTAKSLKKYIDSKATKDLSTAQANIEQTKQSLLVLAENRGTFLGLAGYSDEELKSIVDKIEAELNETSE